VDCLLQIRDLKVEYRAEGASPARVLRGISFELGSAECLGVLGESGCGKSTLALAILRLLPAAACITGGTISFRGRDLTQLNEQEMEGIRGSKISLVFQDTSSALHPVRRVGAQIADVMSSHGGGGSREKALSALREVGLAETERIYSSYPHQISGGQKQRVVIAQALACRPPLLIADEPTSSLDTSIQAEILGLLKRLRKERNLSLVFISHDPAVLAEVADRIAVFYAGEIVEEGMANEVLGAPLHPFTRALLQCMPRAAIQNGDSRALAAIPGSPPDAAETPLGCPFAPRCAERMEVCNSRTPAEVQPAEGRRVRCFKCGG
jgi:oligopeptide/dipeptide ABC transporter ATP-binding protein